MPRKARAKPPSPFRRFNSSPDVIRLVVLMYVRFPLSLRNVEDLLFEHGADICHETVRFWRNRHTRRRCASSWIVRLTANDARPRWPSGANPRGLTDRALRRRCAKWRRVRIRLTAPSQSIGEEGIAASLASHGNFNLSAISSQWMLRRITMLPPH